MHTRQKRRRFIELRGRGVSYRKIAAKINVSTTTLVRWSRLFAVEINNIQVIEFEALQEEYLITRQHRLKVLAAQLNNVARELIDRDLSDVPAHRLVEMQTQLNKELQALSPKMIFSRNIPAGGSEDINRLLNKTVSWAF